jgi:hypothetical protein
MSEKLSLFGRVLDGLGDHGQLIARLAGDPADARATTKKLKRPKTKPNAAAV